MPAFLLTLKLRLSELLSRQEGNLKIEADLI
jgi:hypothetical protein